MTRLGITYLPKKGVDLTLKPNDIIALNNLTAHQTVDVCDAAAHFFPLVAHSRGRNAIEMAEMIELNLRGDPWLFAARPTTEHRHKSRALARRSGQGRPKCNCYVTNGSFYFSKHLQSSASLRTVRQ